MKLLKILALVFSFLVVDGIAAITATSGGLDKNNELFYNSDNDILSITSSTQSIQLHSNLTNLLITQDFEVKKVQKNLASKKLLKSLFKQQVQERDGTCKYNNIVVAEDLSDEKRESKIKEIQAAVKKACITKVKKTKNLISYKITDIDIPDDIKENIEVSYELKVKLELKDMRILNFNELVSLFLSPSSPKINFNKEFLLQDNKAYFLCKATKDKDEVDSDVLGDNIAIQEYNVEIVKNLTTKVKSNFSQMSGDDILVVKRKSNLPLFLALPTKDAKLKKFTLNLITNPNVKEYKRELKDRATVLKGFDFSKEEIRATYKVDASNGVRYLKTSYKMAGKRKNIINVTLDGSSSILNPTASSNAKLLHASYIVDAKTYLFELQKVLKQNDSTKLKWTQKPKKSMLVITYKDSNGKTVKKKISRGKKQFYDISALWYLMHWSATKGIDEKAFLLMREDFPFEAKFTKTGYGYSVSMKTKERFQFHLDNFKRIKKVVDTQNDLEMVLDKNSFVTDTIVENRIYLQKMFKKYRLKEVQVNE